MEEGMNSTAQKGKVEMHRKSLSNSFKGREFGVFGRWDKVNLKAVGG
jgi:hypothetical protein